jgi:uncharacterized protein (UPF0335 family)
VPAKLQKEQQANMTETVRLSIENRQLKEKIKRLEWEKAELERDLQYAYDYINQVMSGENLAMEKEL